MPQISGWDRPGGRTERTRQAVHKAVRELIAETGAESVQIADVARRAGVAPTTIYRRWGAVAPLILDVAVAMLNTETPVPASGNLRADLRTYARTVASQVSGPMGFAFVRAISAASTTGSPSSSGAVPQPQHLPVHAPLGALTSRLEQIRAMIAADPAHGAELVPIDVVDCIVAPIYYRALIGQLSRVTDAELDRFVSNVLAISNYRRNPHRQGQPRPSHTSPAEAYADHGRGDARRALPSPHIENTQHLRTDHHNQ